MSLLAGTLYDPATAVNKVTTANLALTAMDTVNLRLVFAAPPSQRVLVRLAGVLHGATTYPQILLGVKETGVTVGRMAPRAALAGTALATTFLPVEAMFVVSGLTPGSHTWDAAYAVETAVAATGLKYGGPDDTTSDNAFGGFAFEIWST